MKWPQELLNKYPDDSLYNYKGFFTHFNENFEEANSFLFWWSGGDELSSKYGLKLIESLKFGCIRDGIVRWMEES